MRGDLCLCIDTCHKSSLSTMKAHPGLYARLNIPGSPPSDNAKGADPESCKGASMRIDVPANRCHSVWADNSQETAQPMSARLSPPRFRPKLKRSASDVGRAGTGAFKMRRTGLGISFPSVSDLSAFAGISTRGSPPAEGCMRKTKSLSAIVDGTLEPPWRKFEKWKAAHPHASRLECRQYIQKTLQQVRR